MSRPADLRNAGLGPRETPSHVTKTPLHATKEPDVPSQNARSVSLHLQSLLTALMLNLDS